MDAKERFEKWYKEIKDVVIDSIGDNWSHAFRIKNPLREAFEVGYHSRDEEVRLLKYQLECHKEAINVLPSTVDAVYKNKELKELLKNLSTIDYSNMTYEEMFEITYEEINKINEVLK